MIDSLKDRNEVRLFIKSLLSADEIASFMRRIEIAVLLAGDFRYDQIIKSLKVGRDKISAVQKNLLQDDSGYKIIVKRLIENRKNRLKRIKKVNLEAASSSPFKAIKNFSPANRILPDLLDAVVEKFEDDKDLEKEALLFTPSSTFERKKK